MSLPVRTVRSLLDFSQFTPYHIPLSTDTIILTPFTIMKYTLILTASLSLLTLGTRAASVGDATKTAV